MRAILLVLTAMTLQTAFSFEKTDKDEMPVILYWISTIECPQ
jgi:hypothetical protein